MLTSSTTSVDVMGSNLLVFFCFVCFVSFFFFIPFFYLRPFYSLSLLVVTQIRGHIAGSSRPQPTTVRHGGIGTHGSTLVAFEGYH